MDSNVRAGSSPAPGTIFLNVNRQGFTSNHEYILNIHTDISTFKDIKNPVLTIGTFDGVHKGHKIIIDRVNEISRSVGGESVLLTFSPHPRLVLFQDLGLELISSMDEKISLLRDCGLDHLIILPFTKEFSRISAVSYVRDLLVNGIGAHTVVVGYDHHFGRNREGDIHSLNEFAELYDFQVEEIPAQTIDDVEVSSTKIRRALKVGDIGLGRDYLGYAFRLSGQVVKGKQNGRKMGYPTANIQVDDEHKLIPACGVYAVQVVVDDVKYGGMLNIGQRPTIEGQRSEETIEVNIFGLEDDIYFKEIVVLFHERIRDEQYFESMDLLKNQLHADKRKAMEVLAAV